jgi:hypothetical protein
VLLPQNPVGGFDTDRGFVAHIAFTGGVDAETDDQLRARVPIEVQGRVKGTPPRCWPPRCASPASRRRACSRPATPAPAHRDVAGRHCEVYYEGAASCSTQVQSEIERPRVAGQNVSSLRRQRGRRRRRPARLLPRRRRHDALALASSSRDRRRDNAVGRRPDRLRALGGVKAVHDVADVVSVNVPFTDLRKSTDTDNTAGDIECGNVAYPTTAAADVAVTVTDLS